MTGGAPLRTASAILALAGAILLGGCLASLGGDDREARPSHYTGWLHASAGASFGDTLLIDGEAALEAVTPQLALGVGAHYRTPRLDVGVLVEAQGGQRFAGPSGPSPLGSSFRAAASLRWRYIEEAWGALFMHLAPGLTVVGHSDALRARVGALVDAAAATVDDHSVAFSLALGFGVLVNLSERIALSLHLDLVTATTSLATPARDVGYSSVRGLLMAGLEWRM